MADELQTGDRVLIVLVTMDSFSINPNENSTINYETGKYTEVK